MRVNTVFAAAPKTASSWLFAMLKQHPDVVVHPGKYCHFFRDHFDKGVAWYDGQFAPPRTARTAVIDFEPTALLYKPRFERLIQFNQELRLLISVRNPMERHWSDVKHFARVGGSIENRRKKIMDRTSPTFIGGQYATYISETMKYFERERVHVVVFDDIKTRPMGAIEEIECFLGLPSFPNYESSETPVNRAMRAKLPGLSRSLRPLAKQLRNRGLGRFVQWARDHQFVRKTLFAEDIEGELPTDEEAAFLRSEYEDDIRFLEEFLDRDFSHWRRWPNPRP